MQTVASETPAKKTGSSGRIGRFQIQKILGKGAQGVVYLGQDPSLGRLVAIKTLNTGKNVSQDKKDRLIREARTVSRLKHPNVVPLYEAGQHGDSPFLVFEHVEGSSLREILAREAPLPVHRAVSIMAKILDGVASAHKADIIHKDLTPSNILVEEGDIPRIMDFGISIVMGESAHQPQEMAGTLSYMSPEHTAKGPLGPFMKLYSTNCPWARDL